MNPTGDAMYDGQPDNDQVMQDETGLPAVPVRIEGPVRTAELPSRGVGFRTEQVTTAAIRIATADPRRKSLILYPVTGDIYLGSDQSQAGPAGALWPATAPITLTTCDEIWAAAVSTTTNVSVISEQWAL